MVTMTHTEEVVSLEAEQGPWPWNGDACKLLEVCTAKLKKTTAYLHKRGEFESQMVTSMPKLSLDGTAKVTKPKTNKKGKPKRAKKEELGEGHPQTRKVNKKNHGAKLSAAKILLAKKKKAQKKGAEAECFTHLRVCKK